MFIYREKNNSQRRSLSNAHLISCFLILNLLWGLRGDISTDYLVYKRHFLYYQNLELADFFNVNFFINIMEIGFVLLNRLVSIFTSEFAVFIFFLSPLILIPVYKQIKHSEIPWLSLLLYLTIGTFFEGFNILRQILAASIMFYAYKYVLKDQFKKFIFFVVLATTIQMSSILMVISYFLLRLKAKKSTILIYMIVGIVIWVFISSIFPIIDKIFLSSLYTGGSYAGIALSPTRIQSLTPSFIIATFIIVLFLINPFNGEMYENMLYNGTLIWAMLKVLMLQYNAFTRFASFFCIFPILAVPYVIKHKCDPKLRAILLILIIIVLVFTYLFLGYTSINGAGWTSIFESN